MKRYIAMLLVIFSLVSCTSSTQYGDCVGLNGEKNPKLIYKYSAWNIFLGAFFSGFIAPPVVVVLNELECPVGVK